MTRTSRPRARSSARLGVPANDTAEELIAAPDVDAVAICTLDRLPRRR